MKESPMKRLIRFLKGEALPPNPDLDAAIRRAGKKVAKKKAARLHETAGAA